MSWLQTSDTKKGSDRWSQLEQGKHLLPEAGRLFDAINILRRVGKCRIDGSSVQSIRAGEIIDFLTATGISSSPAQIDAALQASEAFVLEYHRSSGESTDAPYNWPKTDRDLEIFASQQEKMMDALMSN